MKLLTIHFLQIAGLATLAILFLQSGIDKITDFKGNKSWLDGHFANSIFKNQVGPLLITITLLEVAAGLLSALGAIAFLIPSTYAYAVQLGVYGCMLSLISLVCLFLGQRIAKDYAGAGGLVPYMILAGLTMYVIIL